MHLTSLMKLASSYKVQHNRQMITGPFKEKKRVSYEAAECEIY